MTAILSIYLMITGSTGFYTGLCRFIPIGLPVEYRIVPVPPLGGPVPVRTGTGCEGEREWNINIFLWTTPRSGTAST